MLLVHLDNYEYLEEAVNKSIISVYDVTTIIEVSNVNNLSRPLFRS